GCVPRGRAAPPPATSRDQGEPFLTAQKAACRNQRRVPRYPWHERLFWRSALPKGHRDAGRQLDALAHVIARDDIKRVAAQWGITRNGVYQLARSGEEFATSEAPLP